MEPTQMSAEDQQNLIEFNRKLGMLLDEHSFDLGAIAFITQTGQIAARPQVFKRQPQQGGVPLNAQAAQGAQISAVDKPLAN